MSPGKIAIASLAGHSNHLDIIRWSVAVIWLQAIPGVNPTVHAARMALGTSIDSATNTNSN
eukprot:6603415-Lingulodinium_polyedra.AAC.1